MIELAPKNMQPDHTVQPIEVLLYTVPQVAKMLQVSTRTVFHLIARGQLPTVKIGTSLRIFSDELLHFARTGTRRIAEACKESLAERGIHADVTC